MKEDWLLTYDPIQRPDLFDQVILTWNTANKQSEFADISVCTAWGLKGKKIYLLDVLRNPLNYPALKQAVKLMSERWHPTKVLIEKTGPPTPS